VKCEEKYIKSRLVHSTMRHIAEKRQEPLEQLNQQIAWPLYKKFGHAYDAFKVAVVDPELVLGELGLAEDLKLELLTNIKRRLTPQAMKIRADIEVTCFGYEGIDAIKAALRAGEACKREDCDIKIKVEFTIIHVASRLKPFW
jgi:translation initiation factor 2 subunit 1